ncbi:hypothetical protein RHGRI_006742 [Rhododendron griersonianum]|uniref:HRDC domain-containing protein n=1 Tax=Rhododendron griersonianum TaxID=479676 RepID=A0AAV6KUI3_9ERIC|nr:hypothetical protein RHGRI_006742 [Rhododendron griersonianum]
MDTDPSQSQPQSTKHKAEALQRFTSGPLSSSLSKLSGSSRGIPSDKDFHFYYNFAEFKSPAKEISDDAQLMLRAIGSSSAQLWGKEMEFPQGDLDDAYDWLVSANDEVFERFDVSVDDFRRARKEEEEGGPSGMAANAEDSESGFQLVYGKHKKKGLLSQVVVEEKDRVESSVKVASRDKKTMGGKPKVPFHVPSIPRPQDKFKIVVNNSNQPFDHVWLQRSEDGSRFIHPLEKFSILDFVDPNVGHVEPVKPPPIESTPFKLVEEVMDLKELAAKLRGVTEFAVDLEHNHYRSFQGLTCLMQISTRTEDFVVDTLKLRIHIGPYLRELFKDPAKKKVMHGADRDIIWLQRDFGIYVCNLFDTGQASRVLKMERNSLEYLLYHFCAVSANKEYQNADWRIRPIPDEMLRYAREDTHYLLHIYDLLRIRLLSASTESENSDDLLVEVYKRSGDLCMQLYEKELLTESSFLYIYGVQGADLNAQQLAIVAGLCEWRDVVARAEDESTGYVLPNKTLLELAKQMPVTTSKLRRLVNSKHPYVERSLGSVVSIIKHSMQNAAAFEETVELIKEWRTQTAFEENMVPADGNEALPPEAPETIKSVTAAQNCGGGISMDDDMSGNPPDSVHLRGSLELGNNIAGICRYGQERASEHFGENGHKMSQADNHVSGLPSGSPIISEQISETNRNLKVSHAGAGATVQVLKKPSRAFGAFLGNSTAKRKFDTGNQDKEEIKLEQIKSSVNLPFHSFVPRDETLQLVVEEPAKVSQRLLHEEPSSIQAQSSTLEDVILLEEKEEDNDEEEGGANVEKSTTIETKNKQLETGDGDETMSLGDLSSSFQNCFKSISETRKAKQPVKPRESGGFLELKPFDYESARKQAWLGNEPDAEKGEKSEGGRKSRAGKADKKKSSTVGKSRNDEESGGFQQGRRRQAFPASGNRSATFH